MGKQSSMKKILLLFILFLALQSTAQEYSFNISQYAEGTAGTDPAPKEYQEFSGSVKVDATKKEIVFTIAGVDRVYNITDMKIKDGTSFDIKAYYKTADNKYRFSFMLDGSSMMFYQVGTITNHYFIFAPKS